jgi:DNA-binding CsgD family transcriptional regulator
MRQAVPRRRFRDDLNSRGLYLGSSAALHARPQLWPKGWWEQWLRLAPNKIPMELMLGRASLAPHTWTDSQRLLQPIGVDRWNYELAMRYGMRDGFSCPVGGRWLVVFWSAKVLSGLMTAPVRIFIFCAANFAAMRVEQLVRLDPIGYGPQAQLTLRELAVLRLLSIGEPFKKVAQELGLGEETVRTHLKKAQTKLGVRNRTQAVAEALRQYLIL